MESQFDEYIVKDGWNYILILGIATLVALLIGWGPLFWPLFFLTLFVIYFFRNPRRYVNQMEDLVVSPADGKVLQVLPVTEKKYFAGEAIKISIFMSVFDVHVNRIPENVSVEKVNYYPGKFLVASLDKASEENERTELFLKRADGVKIMIVQIAGLVARRIVCRAVEGDSFRRGDIFGMIKFGSRLDVFVPVSTQVMVTPGQKVRAGETVLGYLPKEGNHAQG